MAYLALYGLSSSHPYQMHQQMGKVAVQEKIFPNRLLHMPTKIITIKDQTKTAKCIQVYVAM